MMAFLHCPGGTDCDDSDGPSAATAAAARAAQARAAEAAEETARDTYRAAVAYAVTVRLAADHALANAARLITIYANGVSAKS